MINVGVSTSRFGSSNLPPGCFCGGLQERDSLMETGRGTLDNGARENEVLDSIVGSELASNTD